MYRLLTKFLGLSWSKRILLAEAFVKACVALVMVRLVPYSVWRKWLGNPVSIPKQSEQISKQISNECAELTDIVWAFSALYRHARFFTCLMLGFSARSVLHRRRLRGILVLGVDREETKLAPKLLAHAWVVYHGHDIAGGELKDKYTAVAAYSL